MAPGPVGHGAQQSACTLGAPWAAARMGVGAAPAEITTDPCADGVRYVRDKTRPIQITVAAPDPIRSRSPTACLTLASRDFSASVIRKDQSLPGLPRASARSCHDSGRDTALLPFCCRDPLPRLASRGTCVNRMEGARRSSDAPRGRSARPACDVRRRAVTAIEIAGTGAALDTGAPIEADDRSIPVRTRPQGSSTRRSRKATIRRGRRRPSYTGKASTRWWPGSGRSATGSAPGPRRSSTPRWSPARPRARRCARPGRRAASRCARGPKVPRRSCIRWAGPSSRSTTAATTYPPRWRRAWRRRRRASARGSPTSSARRATGCRGSSSCASASSAGARRARRCCSACAMASACS